MLAYLLIILALPSFVDTTSRRDTCDDLYASAEEAFNEIDPARPEAHINHTYLARSQKARTCENDPVAERLRSAYYHEIYALNLFKRRQEALYLLDEFESRFATVPDSSRLWWMYSTRANLNYYLGNLNEAARNYPQALTYAAAASSPFTRVKLLLDFSIALQRLRDFPAARRYRLQASAVLDKLDPSDPSWANYRSRFLIEHADLFLDALDLDATGTRDSLLKAIVLAKEGLALLQNKPLDEQTLWGTTTLGHAYSNLRDFDTALPFYEHALQLARQLESDHHVFLAMKNLGRFYVKAGHLDKAEEILLETLSRMDAASHIDHKRRTLNHLGYLYELRDEPEQAQHFYEQAIDLTEQYHESLRMTDWSATALGKWQRPYRGLIRVLLVQGRFEDAFLALERTRARHLQDLRTLSSLENAFSREDRLRFDSLTTALSATLNRLASDTLSTQEQDALTLQKTRLITERRALLKLDNPLSPPSRATLQNLLAERKQILVSYFIDTKGRLPDRPAQSYVFVLTPEKLTAVPLQASADTVRTLLTPG